MGPLSTFFVGAGIGALGGGVLWLGGEGRHKACPYRGFEGEGEVGAGGGRGQAQGLPLQGRLRGKGKTARVGGTRAGTRPARTGAFEGGRGRRRGWGGEGRGMASTCGDLVGLGGVGWRRSVGWGPVRCRHQVGEGYCRRGGVAGAEPPHKGGPNRPDRPKARRE